MGKHDRQQGHQTATGFAFRQLGVCCLLGCQVSLRHWQGATVTLEKCLVAICCNERLLRCISHVWGGSTQTSDRTLLDLSGSPLYLRHVCFSLLLHVAVLGLSRVCLSLSRSVLRLSRVCLGSVSGLSRVCLGSVSVCLGLSRVRLGSVSGPSQSVSGPSRVCLGPVSICPRHGQCLGVRCADLGWPGII